jgi:hypothetical protein
MVHVAQGAIVLFVAAAVVLLLVRASGVVARALYTRPLLLWTATAVVVLGLLLANERWRSMDWAGMGYFIVVAIAAFTSVLVLCEGYRILKRALGPHR